MGNQPPILVRVWYVLFGIMLAMTFFCDVPIYAT